MFNGEKTGPFASTDHKWVMPCRRGRASIFTTKVDEVGACLICPVGFINPIALLISSFAEIIMIDKVLKPQLLEVVEINIRQRVSVERGGAGTSDGESIK